MRDFKGYKEQNPYHVWIYREDGTKFVGHFKNKRDAMNWRNRFSKRSKIRVGNVTTASQPRRRPQQRQQSYGLLSGFRLRF